MSCSSYGRGEKHTPGMRTGEKRADEENERQRTERESKALSLTFKRTGT